MCLTLTIHYRTVRFMGNRKSGYWRTEKLTRPQREKIVELAKVGVPKMRLAKLYGVSRTYIYQLLKPKSKKTK